MKKFRLFVIPLILIISTACNNNSKYSTYNVSCVGDSITWGHLPNSGIQMDKPYPVLLKEELGFGSVSNYGVPSSTLCNGINSYAPMVDRIEQINKSCNLIIIWGGINDYARDCELGTLGSKDSGNVYGALYNMCNYLSNTFPNSFIMFITPLPAKYGEEIYYVDEIKDAVINVANDQFHFPVLNLTHGSGFEDEINGGRTDGVHPSQEWVKNSLVPKIINFIKENL